jgi:DNA-binding MarR family transcriptional regulator
METTTITVKRLLEVIPQSMARIRTEIRSCVPANLSVPDFRILGSITRGRNLVSDIARDHGVSQPSMSRSIENLVRSGLVERARGSSDRRQAPLRLTRAGEALFRKITAAAEQLLRARVSRLDEKTRQALLDGMAGLEALFMPDHRKNSGTENKTRV